jgi:hypothetical protein
MGERIVKITRSICLALAATFLIAPSAFADNPKLSSNTHKREQAQAERLQRGVRPGELGRNEAAELVEDIREEKHDARQR